MSDLPWVGRGVDAVQSGQSDIGVVVGVVSSSGRVGLVKLGTGLVQGVPRFPFRIVFAEVFWVSEGSNGAADAHPRFVTRLVVPVAQVEVNGTAFRVGLGALGKIEGVFGSSSLGAAV